MVSATTEAWHTLIADAECDQSRFVQIEREPGLRACRILLNEAATTRAEIDFAPSRRMASRRCRPLGVQKPVFGVTIAMTGSRPTTQTPAFSTACAASAAAPAGSCSRHSAGLRPFVPGLALRGRRRTGARLTIAIPPFLIPRTSLATDHGDHNRSLASPDAALQMEDLLPGTKYELSLSDGQGQRWPEQRGLQMRVAVAIMPGLLMAVRATERISLSRMAGRSCCSPGSNSIVPTAAVLPTLKILTVPVWMPEEVTIAATCSVRAHVSMPFCTDYDLLLIAHDTVLFSSIGWRLKNADK